MPEAIEATVVEGLGLEPTRIAIAAAGARIISQLLRVATLERDEYDTAPLAWAQADSSTRQQHPHA